MSLDLAEQMMWVRQNSKIYVLAAPHLPGTLQSNVNCQCIWSEAFLA